MRSPRPPSGRSTKFAGRRRPSDPRLDRTIQPNHAVRLNDRVAERRPGDQDRTRRHGSGSGPSPPRLRRIRAPLECLAPTRERRCGRSQTTTAAHPGGQVSQPSRPPAPCDRAPAVQSAAAIASRPASCDQLIASDVPSVLAVRTSELPGHKRTRSSSLAQHVPPIDPHATIDPSGDHAASSRSARSTPFPSCPKSSPSGLSATRSRRSFASPRKPFPGGPNLNTCTSPIVRSTPESVRSRCVAASILWVPLRPYDVVAAWRHRELRPRPWNHPHLHP